MSAMKRKKIKKTKMQLIAASLGKRPKKKKTKAQKAKASLSRNPMVMAARNPLYNNPMVRAARGLERKVRAPTAQQSSWSIGAPQFNGGKPISVRHREYLQPITTVTAFTGAGRYVVQPGLTDNFPWLGQIAQAFEQYTVSNLKYIYRNRLATNQNVSVYCAMQYDVADPEFKTVEEICTYAGARSEVGWTDFAFDAKLGKSQAYRKYFVRTDALAAGADAQLYDMANFTICAVGTTGALYAGDLFVEYDIMFTNPKMNPALLGAYGAYGVVAGATAAAFAASPLAGYNANKISYFPSSVQEPVVDETKRTITFPSPGTYDVAYSVFDPGNTADIANDAATPQPQLFAVNTPGSAIISLQPTYNSSLTAGTGWASYLKVATLVANAALTMKTLASTGTSAGQVQGLLNIAVEAAPFVLSLLGASPVPPLDDLTYQNLRKCYPKADLSAFERKRQILRFELDHAEYKRVKLLELERKAAAEMQAEVEFKERENSRIEEIAKITLDDSGSDVEVNVSRSSSREPGSKKSKKTDLKNRKV